MAAKIQVPRLTQVPPITHACQHHDALPEIPWHVAELADNCAAEETKEHVCESREKQRA